MKSIYVLTARDCQTDSWIATSHYSNRNAAHGSFETLREHLVEKYNVQDIERWTFTDGGDHQTEILDSRINLTLVKQSLNKEVSEWV
ncbi:MAG: hypothetical protein GY827_04480 [Cytophagales bacterium]|nr:hypothetical protein [Cytophagales bacterium]